MSTPNNDIKDNLELLTVEVAEPTPKADPGRNLTPDDDNNRRNRAEDDNVTMSEILNERATEDESSLLGDFRLSNILAGEMLKAKALRKQVWLILLVAAFIIINSRNRYSCQRQLIEIDKLKKELQDIKYRALSNTSQLTQQCRQSNVINMLKANNDSTLKIPSQPPYQINIPK